MFSFFRSETLSVFKNGQPAFRSKSSLTPFRCGLSTAIRAKTSNLGQLQKTYKILSCLLNNYNKNLYGRAKYLNLTLIVMEIRLERSGGLIGVESKTIIYAS